MSSIEALTKSLEKARVGLTKLEGQKDTKELDVCDNVISPILAGLGWQDFPEVRREFPVNKNKGGKRNSVDYALCLGRDKRPRVFLEVKDIGKADKAAKQQFRTKENQLFGYIYDSRKDLKVTPTFGILTDGKHWHIYLPHTGKTKQVPKRIWSFNLAEGELSSIAPLVYALLNREEIKNRKAQKTARQILREKDSKDIKEVIPSAWNRLINKERSPIVEALSTEITNERVWWSTQTQQIKKDVRDFLMGLKPTSHQTTEKKEEPKPPESTNTTGGSRKCSYIWLKQKHTAKDAQDAFEEIFKKLHEKDTSFLKRFADKKPKPLPTPLRKNEEDFHDLKEYRLRKIGGYYLNVLSPNRDKLEHIKTACELVKDIELGKDLVLTKFGKAKI